MTPERWHQVEEVYQLVLQRDASQRAAFLKQACAGDDEMQREIESLLAHQEPANKFMEAPGMVVLAQAMAQDRAGSMIGRQIGAYQILALLGVGGMGEVYQARDTRLGRLVAFKVLPPGMATDPERRGRGIGTRVLAAALDHVRAAGGTVIWCNARTPARTLYERAGFAAHGDEWVDPVIGPHVAMWRRL